MEPTHHQHHNNQVQQQQGNPNNPLTNSAAVLLQQLGGYGLLQLQQQQQQQASQLPIQTQFQIVSHQQQLQHQRLQFPMSSTMTATMSPSANHSGNIPRLHYPDRERQVKRRTKTGCMTCRKRRIKCDELKPICFNCQKSHRECEGYSHANSQRSNSATPPFHSTYNNDYSTPSTLSGQQTTPVSTTATSSFSPINQRRVPQTPRFTPYEVYPRTPVEQTNIKKEFDPLSGSDYLATEFANEFVPEFTTSVASEELSTPPPTARISIDSLLNLSSAALVHPPIDAPLNALFSPTTNILPAALLKPYNAGLFTHWINILSQAMSTLDRFPTDSSVLEVTPEIYFPGIRVPHEDSVYSFLIPHLAMAPTGTGVLHATLACAASHRRDRIFGMKHYHLAVRAIREDFEKGTSYFVAVVLLGMYEVLGGRGIRCMYLARDWILEHKAELKSKLNNEGMEVTVRDVIIEHMMWTFARTAIHRGLSSLPSISPREEFILPMSDFRELYVPREGGNSTVGVADSLVILLAQLLSLPILGELELKAHIAHQLNIWPSTLPRAFRHQWTSSNTISTTSLSAMHFLHPSMATIHLLHRAGIIYFSIYFNFNISRKSSPEAISAARDVLRITQPLIDEASSGRWSVLGALTLAFGPVFIAGQFLKYHLRDTPFVLPQMDWLDESLGEIVETEEDVELREVERMIERLKIYLGGVEGRVVEI